MAGNAYSFCVVCQINHNQSRKHLFTKKHKQRLKWILQKYGTKVKLYKGYMENPVIQQKDQNEDQKINFWCYFCSKEESLHITDGQKTILYGGFFEHLANDTHCIATEKYWNDNGIPSETKAKFVIPKLDFFNFKKKLIPMVEKYDTAIEKRTLKLAKTIKDTENQRCLSLYNEEKNNMNANESKNVLYKTVRSNNGILQNPSGYHDSVRVWRSGIIKYPTNSDQLIQSKYTQHSKSQPNKISNIKIKSHVETDVNPTINGLTKVQIKVDPNKGNIFTGATPPWLINESKDGTEIKNVGPSLSDYETYLKKTAKAKLNPNRVGANFDHTINPTASSSQNWLPSFGRVWNDGARWKSRNQYRTESCEQKKRKVEE